MCILLVHIHKNSFTESVLMNAKPVLRFFQFVFRRTMHTNLSDHCNDPRVPYKAENFLCRQRTVTTSTNVHHYISLFVNPAGVFSFSVFRSSIKHLFVSIVCMLHPDLFPRIFINGEKTRIIIISRHLSAEQITTSYINNGRT